MKIISFKEQTTVYAEDQSEYLDLPAHVFKNSPDGRICCCWELALIDRLKILFYGVIWHEVLTFGNSLQPQKLSTTKPDMPKDV